MDNIINNLKKRRIQGHYFDTRESLLEFLHNELSEDNKITFGGSMTLKELGLFEDLTNKGKQVNWHWNVSPEERLPFLLDAMKGDVYMASANALIEDGRIMNIDGNGNRVAGMIFGFSKVILIVGKNKISSNYDDAFKRIKEISCVKNAKRLNLNTPCAVIGKCTDCTSPQRMCNVTSIIEGKIGQSKMIVCILNEEIGY